MTEQNKIHSGAAGLRQRAEQQLQKQPAAPDCPPEDVQSLLHNLQVHQIELEMQNEELRRAQAELEASRARYFYLNDLAPVGYLTMSERGLIVEANLTLATLLGLTKSDLLKKPLTRFIAREDQDMYYQHRRKLFATGASQTCEVRMVKQGGDVLWVHLQASLARAGDNSPVCATVISDISELKQAEDELRRRAEHLAALNRIAGALSTPPDMTAVVSRVLDALHGIVGCDSIGISVWDAKKQSHVLRVVQGASAAVMEAILASIPGEQMLAGEPVFLERMQDDPDVNPILRQAGYQSGATLPLISGQRLLGLLTLGSCTHTTWQEDERSLLVTVGHQVTAAFEGALLWEELQQKEALRARLLEQVIHAQEDERTRVARELHDDVGQLLTALIMRLGAMQVALSEADDQAGHILTDTEKLAAEALQAIRRMIHDLRPPILDDLGLAPALRHLGDALHERTEVIVKLDTTDLRGRLPPQMETALFRIVQEALSNVREHAGARRVIIRLAMDEKRVTLDVHDDGVGIAGMMHQTRKGDIVNFDRWNIEHGHFGLVGMRERANLMGGTLEIRSGQEGGTTILVEVPLPAGAA